MSPRAENLMVAVCFLLFIAFLFVVWFGRAAGAW